MVDNQLRDNDPPSTKEAYQKLLDAGYSMREAKEKIGVVVLTEIYDVMKRGIRRHWLKWFSIVLILKIHIK